jgi:hypothetical protein
MGRATESKAAEASAAGQSAPQLRSSYHLIGKAILFGVSIAIYLNSLECGFVFDDRLAVQENKV